MKKFTAALLALLLLTGCSSNAVPEVTFSETIALDVAVTETTASAAMTESAAAQAEIPYQSRFDSVTEVLLSDEGIQVDGGGETDSVFTSNDIIYYEDKESYESGNPYGEGTEGERHTAEEAAAHTVVNITKPGAYRVSGKLSAGQIRVDLGDDAYEDPNAVVELILEDAEVLCTVAPAILFLNTYECDGNWSTETAQAEVDTTAAGANLILEGENLITGSHVAKIFKDKDGEKKLWKQDGAIYSYMSLNVFGPGSLELNADNEGLNSELHLTINGGSIDILSHNDGINTNEDGVSVTTINGGDLHIIAGIGEEGDGIDSNGYLVINGGSVISLADPASDAGLDSDLGSYINGGTVVALGSTMDWAESDSSQVTMNLQFADFQSGAIEVKTEDGTTVFSYDPSKDETLIARQQASRYMGVILSHAAFQQGETYCVYVDDVQMAYTGNDVGRGGPGGGMPMGDRPEMPEGMEFPEGERPEMPEGMEPGQRMEFPEGETMPEGFDPSQMGGGRGQGGQRPEGDMENMTPREGFDGEMPTLPEGETMPEGGFGGRGGMGGGNPSGGEASTEFYMNDKVNAFSGVMPIAYATQSGES